MRCPNDGTALVITERAGVEIDYCPECRGVWLDRGELDKIIASAGSGRYDHDDEYSSAGRHRNMRVDHEYGDMSHDARKRKRRESFLGDLFDF